MREIVKDIEDWDYEGSRVILIRENNCYHYRYIEYEQEGGLVWRNPFEMNARKQMDDKKHKYLKKGAM